MERLINPSCINSYSQQTIMKRVIMKEKESIVNNNYYDHMDTDDYSVCVGDDSNP